MAFTYGKTTYATLVGSTAKAYEVRVGYEPQTYSIADNTTPVNLILQVRTISSSYRTHGTQTSKLGGIDFSSKSFNVKEKNIWVTFASTTITVTHNSDGTYSETVSGSFTTNLGEQYGLKSGSASVDMVLPTIPRATIPTISSSVITMGSSATITLNPASGTFKHKLKYSFGGVANLTSGLSIGNDFTVSGTSTLTFTPPKSLGDYIPTSTGGHAIISCTTYDANGTQIGEPKTITVTVNVPSYTPTVSISIKGNNLLSGVYVQGKSTATYTITASGNYGSTIQTYTSTLDGVTYSGSSFTTNVLSSGTKTLSVKVVDSRGKTVTKNATSINVEPYTVPSITSFTASRSSDETTVIAKMVGSVASVGGKNTSKLTISLNGETKIVTSGQAVTFTNISTEQTYTAVASITDAYTTISKNVAISTTFIPLDFMPSGTGIGVGKVAEEENLLDINLPVRFRKPVYGIETGGGGDIDLSAYALKEDVPSLTSQLTNDSGFITLNDVPTSGGNVDDVKVNGTSVVVNKIAHIALASYIQDGAMSKVDKAKLDSFAQASDYVKKNEIPDYSLGINGDELSLNKNGETVSKVNLPSSGGGNVGSLKATDDGNGNVVISIV